MSLSISVCMSIVSNAVFMSNATVRMRSGGSFWLKPVVDQCSAVNVECCCSVYLVFVFSMVNTGRWSELSLCFVCQVVLFVG